MIAHPKRFRPATKNTSSPIRLSASYNDALAYDSGVVRDPQTGHMYSTTQEGYPRQRTYLKTPSHPTYPLAIYGDLSGGHGVYNIGGQDYSAPNFGETWPLRLPGFAGGRDEYDDAMDFIAGYEDFSATPYNHDGIWTIGYGSTDPTLVRKGKISKAEARGAMRNYLVGQDRKLGTLIPGFAGLPDTAKNALRSYNYNYNITAKNSPKLLKALSTQNWAEAARQMDAGWNQVGQGGLRKRRQAERDLFLSGFNTAQPAAPVVQPVVQPKSQLVQQLETQPVFQPVINPLRMRERSSSMMPSMEQYMQSILQ